LLRARRQTQPLGLAFPRLCPPQPPVPHRWPWKTAFCLPPSPNLRVPNDRSPLPERSRSREHPVGTQGASVTGNSRVRALGKREGFCSALAGGKRLGFVRLLGQLNEGFLENEMLAGRLRVKARAPSPALRRRLGHPRIRQGGMRGPEVVQRFLLPGLRRRGQDLQIPPHCLIK